MNELAIYGGKPTVPEGTFKPWPPIDDTDRSLVMASLEGDSHAWGPNCTALEEEFAAWNGNRFAIATNSGTAALHMAVAAVGCGAGDQVIVPAYSWSSSATCIIHHNAIPVFVDIDYDTMNMDPGKIEAAITGRTRAIMVVHLHGLSADMDAIADVARRHDLKIIEDACQAHGALYHGKKVGTIGHCGAFSFNQNKCLSAGEGGMFVTDDEEIARKARMVWSFGESRTPVQQRDYHAYALGWMYRTNDLSAAYARAQLRKLDGYLETQRRHAAILLERLRDLPGLVLPVEPPGMTHNWYNFTSRIDPAAVPGGLPGGSVARFRDAVMAAIKAEGVEVGVWQRYVLPAMTVFQARNAYGMGSPWATTGNDSVVYDPAAHPVAQKHCDHHFGMTFPIRSPQNEQTVELIAQAFRKVFEQLQRIDPRRILEPTG